jgi:MarR family transcriptional regulator, 2-MHQ and catechol-resistance regulon repressor
MPSHFAGDPAERQALDSFIKLVRAADCIAARSMAHLAASGLSPSQFGVLEALLHLGPLHQKELSRKLLKSGGNITVVVDHLEQRGLVRRVRDAEDRRHITVHLSVAGRRLIAGVFPRHARGMRELMAVLSLREQEQLGRLCRKLGRASCAVVGRPEASHGRV